MLRRNESMDEYLGVPEPRPDITPGKPIARSRRAEGWPASTGSSSPNSGTTFRLVKAHGQHFFSAARTATDKTGRWRSTLTTGPGATNEQGRATGSTRASSSYSVRSEAREWIADENPTAAAHRREISWTSPAGASQADRQTESPHQPLEGHIRFGRFLAKSEAGRTI